MIGRQIAVAGPVGDAALGRGVIAGQLEFPFHGAGGGVEGDDFAIGRARYMVLAMTMGMDSS